MGKNIINFIIEIYRLRRCKHGYFGANSKEDSSNRTATTARKGHCDQVR